MSERLRNILVHLDAADASATRLRIAATLAARDSARLLGLYAQHGFPHRTGPAPEWPTDARRQAAETARQRFTTATQGLGAADWDDASRETPDQVTTTVIAAARTVDLAILGQNGPRGGLVPPDLPEQVVLHGGRPVLVIPYAGEPVRVGERPVFAWNGSREAARAINDALALLPESARAVVISVRNQHAGTETAVDAVLRHLALHGIAAEADALAAGGVGLMDLLLNRVSDLGGDLLVMGAYGHYGFPQLARGNGTRYMLAHMTVPVLFSH